jgi:hypothetical protein
MQRKPVATVVRRNERAGSTRFGRRTARLRRSRDCSFAIRRAQAEPFVLDLVEMYSGIVLRDGDAEIGRR